MSDQNKELLTLISALNSFDTFNSMDFTEKINYIVQLVGKKWFIHNQKDNKGQVINRTIFNKNKAGFYEVIAEGNLRTWKKACVVEIQKMLTYAKTQKINETLDNVAILLPEISKNDFLESRKTGIPFLNGVFDFEKGKLRAYKTSDLFFSPLPHKYPARIKVKNQKWFMEQLTKWVGENNSEYFLYLLSYLLFQYPNDLHIWINFFGTGANGKSMCLWLLEEILGHENTASTDLGHIDKHTTSAWIDKYLVVARDSSEKMPQKANSIIKSYTGDGRFYVNPKHKTPYTAISVGKLVASTNFLLETTDTSEGGYRRLITVPFPNKFKIGTEQSLKKEFRDKIKDIIALLCTTICKYKQNGFNNQVLTEAIPPELHLLKYQIWKNNNPILQWLEEYFNDKGNPVSLPGLAKKFAEGISQNYKEYSIWHQLHFNIKPKGGKNKFGGEQGTLIKSMETWFIFHRDKHLRKLVLKPDFF